MEERYPIIDDEGEGMVCESLGIVDYALMPEEREVDAPPSGPSTWNDIIADIEASEQQFKAGMGVPWESVKQMMADRINGYAC